MPARFVEVSCDTRDQPTSSGPLRPGQRCRADEQLAAAQRETVTPEGFGATLPLRHAEEQALPSRQGQADDGAGTCADAPTSSGAATAPMDFHGGAEEQAGLPRVRPRRCAGTANQEHPRDEQAPRRASKVADRDRTARQQFQATGSGTVLSTITHPYRRWRPRLGRGAESVQPPRRRVASHRDGGVGG